MKTMTVLVTAIGSFSADCVITTLKSKGHKVVGCDIYPAIWHAVSKDCDNVYQAPFATKEQEYISFLYLGLVSAKIHSVFFPADLDF